MASRDGERSFWRNPWTWGIGGCLLGCVLLPILFVAILGGGAFWAFRSAGFTELKDEAVARAKASPAVVEVLGEPIEAGFPRNSSINIQSSSGEAQMLLPLSGPKGRGRLRIEAERRDGQPWEFETLLFLPEDRQGEIDLLGTSPGETPL